MEAKPLIHMYDDNLFLIYQKWEKKPELITRCIPVIYGWCYCTSFALLTVQFAYRYIAICKNDSVACIEGRKVLYWIFGASLVGASWSAAMLIPFSQTDRSDESFRYLALDFYSLDVNRTEYVSYKYYIHENDTRRINNMNFIGIGHHMTVIMIALFILIFCGVSIFVTAKKQSSASSKTRQLQMQLFRGLVFQALIPFFFNFIPLMFILFCPYLDIQLGPKTNYQIIITQLYPAMDPIVLFFIIEDYRNKLLDIIKLRFASNIAVYDYDQSQYADFMRGETETRRVTIF